MPRYHEHLIDSSGNVGSIVTGALYNSQIFAGTAAGGETMFPPVSEFASPAVISGVHLRKIKGAVLS